MIHLALRQAILVLVTLSAVALVLSTGGVGGTFAIFNAETQNAGSVFAGGWIDPPASVTVTPSGYDVGFAWTPGTHGPVTGQKLYGVDNGTNSSCTGASVVLLATMASTSTAAYNDSNRASTLNGHWFCYQLVSTSATAWTGVYSAGLQIGLATTGISIANGASSTANSVDVGDTITLTFNQKTNLAGSGNKKVCVVAPGTIIIGDTASGPNSCAAGDGFNVGNITGVAVASTQAFGTSTFTTSSAAPWTMTITLAGTGTPASTSGTATFVPSASIQSNASTHRAVLCTRTDSNCQPTTSTHF